MDIKEARVGKETEPTDEDVELISLLTEKHDEQEILVDLKETAVSILVFGSVSEEKEKTIILYVDVDEVSHKDFPNYF